MKTKTKKLYRVTLRGMTYSSTGIIEGISYVVARNSDEAYQKVKSRLDDKDYGFAHERELDKIELLAEAYEYTDTKTILYI
jgi:hypothetical protein